MFLMLRQGEPAALRARLPSLKTLGLFLLEEPGTEIWEHMFPPGHAFDQIQALNVSLVIEVEVELDPCDSAVLVHFSTVFPQLRTLKHIKRVKKGDAEPIDWVCKHFLQNGMVAARCSMFNPWKNLHDDSKRNIYYLPMQHLLKDHESDPFLFFDMP